MRHDEVFAMHTACPVSTLEIIEASGHLPHLTTPHQVIEPLHRVLG